MTKSIFDHFARINKTSAKPTDDDLADFNSWVAETYYSMHEDSILLIELLSTLRVPDKIYETFLRSVIQKGKRVHFWPKGKTEERIQSLASWYDVSIEKAMEIEKLIPNSNYAQLKELHKK